jgi:TRAP-type mannitol/chloroaromatic compound transport system substrate-binding protein
MFNFLRKKTKIQKLKDKYKALIEEAYHLSKYNRAKSDAKTAEASRILSEIEKIENTK